MKKLIYLLFPMFLLFACNNNAEKTNDENETKCENEESKCSHDESKCKDVICVDKLLQDPEAYVGKEITVGGKCTHVCEHSGKNIFIASPKNEENILVGKAGEGIEAFDANLLGKKVMLKGVLKAVEATAEAETHHDITVKYYLEVSEVKECACGGHKEGEGCAKHAEGKECGKHKEGEGCAKHKEGAACGKHKEGEGCKGKKE